MLDSARSSLRRLGIVAALALLMAGCAGAAVAPAPTTPAAGENARALRPFLVQLAGLENGGRQTLHILQLGDSHTAADFLSGRVRERLQSQFGTAGRGTLPPGLPYRGIRQAGFKISVGGRWDYENSLNPKHDGPYGIAGFNARSRSPGSAVTLDSDAAFDRVTVTVWQEQSGGRLDVLVDGRLVDRVETAGDGPRLLRYDLPSGGRQLRLVAAERRPVTLLDYGVESRAPGIVYDALGVVGATVGIIDKWDHSLLRSQVAERDPALIVLAFGTNEGYADTLNDAAYAAQFAATIRALKSAAPKAAIAVIGPPDVARPLPGCKPSSAACSWSTPEALGRVRAIQRGMAASEGYYFWDWSAIMLESGGIGAWAESAAPLARPDRVHLTIEGYNRSGDAFFDALMRAYRDFRSGRSGS